MCGVVQGVLRVGEVGWREKKWPRCGCFLAGFGGVMGMGEGVGVWSVFGVGEG